MKFITIILETVPNKLTHLCIASLVLFLDRERERKREKEEIVTRIQTVLCIVKLKISFQGRTVRCVFILLKQCKVALQIH